MYCSAVVGHGDGAFGVEEVAIAEPVDDQVLVDIHVAGICHTDWDMIRGATVPFVVGHEGAGVVCAVGPQVKRFSPGDAVVLHWADSCGHCEMCRDGLRPLCEVSSPANGKEGGGVDATRRSTHEALSRSFSLGTMAEQTLVSEGACEPMMDGVPMAIAAIMGCGVMTGFGSVVNVARVEVGASVAVLGCGGVGLSVIQGAKVSAAQQILAIDVSEERLEQARAFGATDLVLSEPGDPQIKAARDQVFALTERGADYAFECTGRPELGAAPLALIRHGGTAVQVSGIEQTIPFDCSLFEWDKTYINPLYGRCDPRRDFERMQQLYLSGQLTLDPMISKRYALNDIEQAFDDLLAGRLAKGVIDLKPGAR